MSDRRMAFPRRGLGDDSFITLAPIDYTPGEFNSSPGIDPSSYSVSDSAPSSGIDRSSYSVSPTTTPTPARVATPTAAPASSSPFLPGTFIPTPNTLTGGYYSQVQGPGGAAVAESYTARASVGITGKDVADFTKALLPSLFAAGGQVGATYLATQQPRLAASSFNLVPSPTGGYVQKPAAATSSGPGIGTVLVGGLLLGGLGYVVVKAFKGRGR